MANKNKIYLLIVIAVLLIISVLTAIFLNLEFDKNIKIVWKHETGPWIKVTPVIYKDQVIIATMNTLYCINKDTGKLKWKSEFDHEIFVLSHLNQNKIYIETNYEMKFTKDYKNISIKPIIYCVDLDIGKIIWELSNIDTTGISESLNGKFVNGNLVYFEDDSISYIDGNTGKIIKKGNVVNSKENLTETEVSNIKNKVYHNTDKGLACINLDTLELVWKTNFQILPTFIIANDRIYADSRDCNFYCLDKNTGKLIWKHKLNTDSGDERLGFSTPFLYDNKIYIGGDYTSNYIYCLNSENGKLIWKYKTEDIVVTTPFVINDKLYIASADKFLYCLNAINGNLIWKYKVGSLFSSPIINDNKIYIGSLSKRCLYCLEER
jgi:outer membrane protein assembly factor BamB